MKPARQQSYLRYPLNSIFASERFVRVLRVLFRHGDTLGATRIARDAGLSRYGAREALGTLVAFGVIEAVGSGKSISYRIDMRHPLASAIANLFDAETERADAVIDAVKAAVEVPEIAGAWLYGSFARGEDRVGSDLDIAIVTPIRDDHAADLVRERLDDSSDRLRFSPSVVGFDFADAARMSGGDPWWKNLIGEAIVMKGGRPETLISAEKSKSRG